jgi:hypothetical protein
MMRERPEEDVEAHELRWANLRAVADPDESLPSPLGVLRGDLNTDGASDCVVTGREPAHANQVLDALALNDISNVVGLQRRFRDGDQDRVAGAKYSDEVVIDTRHSA